MPRNSGQDEIPTAAMSQLDIENARRGYATLNQVYRSGNPNDFRPFLEEFWDAEVVLAPAGFCQKAPASKAGTASSN
jgi:hypothetical protein